MKETIFLLLTWIPSQYCTLIHFACRHLSAHFPTVITIIISHSFAPQAFNVFSTQTLRPFIRICKGLYQLSFDLFFHLCTPPSFEMSSTSSSHFSLEETKRQTASFLTDWLRFFPCTDYYSRSVKFNLFLLLWIRCTKLAYKWMSDDLYSLKNSKIHLNRVHAVVSNSAFPCKDRYLPIRVSLSNFTRCSIRHHQVKGRSWIDIPSVSSLYATTWEFDRQDRRTFLYFVLFFQCFSSSSQEQWGNFTAVSWSISCQRNNFCNEEILFEDAFLFTSSLFHPLPPPIFHPSEMSTEARTKKRR